MYKKIIKFLILLISLIFLFSLENTKTFAEESISLCGRTWSSKAELETELRKIGYNGGSSLDELKTAFISANQKLCGQGAYDPNNHVVFGRVFKDGKFFDGRVDKSITIHYDKTDDKGTWPVIAEWAGTQVDQSREDYNSPEYHVYTDTLVSQSGSIKITLDPPSGYSCAWDVVYVKENDDWSDKVRGTGCAPTIQLKPLAHPWRTVMTWYLSNASTPSGTSNSWDSFYCSDYDPAGKLISECTSFGPSSDGDNKLAWCGCAKKCAGKTNVYNKPIKAWEQSNYPQCVAVWDQVVVPVRSGQPTSTPAQVSELTSWVELSKNSGFVNGEEITVTFRAQDKPGGPGARGLHTSFMEGTNKESEAKTDMDKWGKNYKWYLPGQTVKLQVPFYLEHVAEDNNKQLERINPHKVSVPSLPTPTPTSKPSSAPTNTPIPTLTLTPTLTPTPTSPPVKVTHVRIGESEADLNNSSNDQPFINEDETTVEPILKSYTLKDQTPGKKRIFVRFFFDKGNPVTKFADITYNPDPAISSIKCEYDPSGTGTKITILGKNFGTHSEQGQGNVQAGSETGTILSWGEDLSSSNSSRSTPEPTITKATLTPTSSPAPTASEIPTPTGQLRNQKSSKVVAKIKEKVEGVIPVRLTLDSGKVVDGRCGVNTTTVSFSAKLACRPHQNFGTDNVEVKIFEVARGVTRPLTQQKTVISTVGQVLGFEPKLEIGKKYALTIKVPKSVAKVVEFTAEEGTTILDNINLPTGDIAPSGGPDGVINSLDKAELVRQWTASTDINRPGDFNLDGRINSLDYSCMKNSFNASDEKFVAPSD